MAQPDLALATGIPKIWGSIPAQNLLFTGRDGLLANLHDQLSSRPAAAALPPADSAGLVPRALQGLPGVGKTQVAVEYAHRNQGDYDLVWWIPADQPHLIRGSIAALAQPLGLPANESASMDDRASEVLDRLRRGDPVRRWLLIFDNADKPEDLGEFVLPDGPGHTIITSRNPDWHNVVTTLTVQTFTRAESRLFLRKHLRNISNKDSDRLNSALGGLPLAMEQAGALQARTGMSVQEYLEILDKQASRLLDQGKPADYPVSATIALTASFNQLITENPQAIELLRCCSFFGPDPIPREVLSARRDGEGTILATLFSDPVGFNRAISDLGRYSLAQVDYLNRTLQVHRVTQTIVRESLSAEQRQQFQHGVHILLEMATPNDSDNPTSWPRYRELLPHYEPARVIECRSSRVRLLVRGVIRYLYMTG
ncbi:MAG TPA: FxSxx-COOH system tetratricopeptide repeat protein, partial [Streptosporangiaceae bacterium]|nr:FxSxx-COOH system tetratricopeptide repeat protein [Streptosporangiaceae bacterium]